MLIPMCAFLIELGHDLLSAALASGTLAGAPWRACGGKGSLMPDVSFTELPGRRVLVRRFRPEDVAEFVAYRSDAEVARYQSWDAPYPPDEGRALCRSDDDGSSRYARGMVPVRRGAARDRAVHRRLCSLDARR